MNVSAPDPINPLLAKASGEESAMLAAFAADLTAGAVPGPVFDRAVDLFVDWVGSALSGRGQAPTAAMEALAAEMGPADGGAEMLTSRRTTSPLFAALVNGAASHISEQDDVHNGSVFHPGAVVFPAALAIAQQRGASGRDFLLAAVTGYEVGIRVGSFLGRSHYKVFHTTGTAGTLAAAAAAGKLIGLPPAQMRDALGSAGTQAAGLWEFLRDAAHSKQLHTGKAAADGIVAASLAAKGFTGARRILEGAQGMAAGMSRDADPAALIDGLGSRWALLETSFKFHAACRHTHPAADALLQVLEAHDLPPERIRRITARVHQGAIDVLGAVAEPTSVHQAKFSMPATLGLIAVHRRAGMAEFDGYRGDDRARSFLDRIEMRLDQEVDAAYPGRWIGKVEVSLDDGTTLSGRVDEPKGDPGNTLSRQEIDGKVRRLASYGGAVSQRELDRLMPALWSIAALPQVGRLLPPTVGPGRR